MTNNELRLLARTIILEESQIYQNPSLIETLSGVNTKEIAKLKSESEQIIQTAITCYKEVKKQELQTYLSDQYHQLITQIETKLNITSPEPSLETLEINKYASAKTTKFLSLTYPEIYEENKSYLNKQEAISKLKYQAHDGSDLIERYYEQIRVDKKQRKEIPSILKTFISHDGTYKPLDIILADKNYSLIDERIKYIILTSKTFLKKIDLLSLTKQELEYLRQIITTVANMYEEVSNLSDDYFEPQSPQIEPRERYELLIIRSRSSLRTIELKNYSNKITKVLFQTGRKVKRKRQWKY